jgi:hypothetical protein
MSSSIKVKPILKRGTPVNKTKKNVVINTDLNEGYIKIPEHITDSTKSQRWATATDEKINREHVRNKREGFKKARKEAPILAAIVARRKFNIRDEDHISLSRSARSTRISVHPSVRRRTIRDEPARIPLPRQEKGPISSAVTSVFRFFSGKRGGKRTRKNRK